MSMVVIVNFASTFLVWLIAYGVDRGSNWIVAQTIYRRRTEAIIRSSDFTDRRMVIQFREEFESLIVRLSPNRVWGADLAAIAISLDLAMLGVWLTEPKDFPFFSHFNGEGQGYEVVAWLLLFLLHGGLMVGAVFFKHIHEIRKLRPDSRTETGIEGVNRLKRVYQNRWSYGNNFMGFFALLSAFMVASDALWG